MKAGTKEVGCKYRCVPMLVDYCAFILKKHCPTTSSLVQMLDLLLPPNRRHLLVFFGRNLTNVANKGSDCEVSKS